MKRIPLLLLSLLCCTISWAQSRKQLQEVTERTLLVVLDEVRHDLKAVQEIAEKDPQRIQAYQDSITLYNQRLQETVQRYWRFHAPEDIRFVTRTELNAIPEAEEKQYVLLLGMNANARGMFLDHITTYYSDKASFTRLALYFKENFRPREDGLMSVMAPYTGNDVEGKTTLYPHPNRDVLFINIITFQLYLDRILNHSTFNDFITTVKSNQQRLKDKKLVVPKEWMKEKKFSKRELQRAYPYPVEAANGRQYSQLLEQEADNCVFLILTKHPINPPPFSAFLIFHFVVDGTNGDLLAISPTKRGPVTNYSFTDYIIKEKNVEDYVKFLEK